MRSGLSLDQVFPIRDSASATLARRKADCLFEAGVIDAEDRLAVYGRSATMLDSGSAPEWPLAGRDMRHGGEQASARAS